MSIYWRVTAGGLGGLGVADTGGRTVAVTEIIWDWTKQRSKLCFIEKTNKAL